MASSNSIALGQEPGPDLLPGRYRRYTESLSVHLFVSLSYFILFSVYVYVFAVYMVHGYVYMHVEPRKQY